MKTITKEGNNIKIVETVDPVTTVIDNSLFIEQKKTELVMVQATIDQLQDQLSVLQARKTEIKQNISDFKLASN